VLVDAVDERAIQVEQEPLGPIHPHHATGAKVGRWCRVSSRGWLVATIRP
jgi:hypothetical protein